MVESPALFLCEFSIKCMAVCNAIAGSGVAGRWVYLFAHTTAIQLKDISILKGYETVGEERRSRTEEIDLSR